MKKQNLSFSARYALSVLVAGFAAALLVFPPAYADEGFGVDGREDVLKQASAMVETILESDENTRFGLGLPSEVDVAALSLGECIQAYEVADSSYAELPTHCWPIFYEGDVIASIVASYDNNGETLYRFSTDGASIMQEHYRENGLGALVLDGDGRIGDMLSPSDAMETGQSCESYFEGAKRSGDVDNLARKEIEYSSQSEKTPIAIPCEEGESEELEGGLSYGEGNFSAENDSVALASYGPVNLGVPLIYQGNTPTCWVASSKCIGQYLTGINRSIDDIHRYVKGFSSYQGGDGNDAVTALSFFIYPGTRTAIKAEYKTAWMSDSELYRWLSNGIPVYARLEETPSGGPKGTMLCGGTWTMDGKAYRFDSSGICLNP